MTSFNDDGCKGWSAHARGLLHQLGGASPEQTGASPPRVLPQSRSDVVAALEEGWFGPIVVDSLKYRASATSSLLQWLLSHATRPVRNDTAAHGAKPASTPADSSGHGFVASNAESAATLSDVTSTDSDPRKAAVQRITPTEARPCRADSPFFLHQQASSISLPTALQQQADSHKMSYILIPPPQLDRPASHSSESEDSAMQPALGTWAARQRRWLDPQELAPAHSGSRSHPHSFQASEAPPAPHITNADGSTSSRGLRNVRSDQQLDRAAQLSSPDPSQRPAQPAAGGQTLAQQAPIAIAAIAPGHPVAVSDNRDIQGASADASNAVWRWRFARRWQAEQQRVADPDAPSSCIDKTEEALHFLKAGGGAGWNMQVSSLAGINSAEASKQSLGMLQTMGSLNTQDLLLEDGSLSQANSLLRNASKPHAGCGTLSATREVNSMNRRAVQLLAQQEELQRAAEERWRQSLVGHENWVGAFLDAVQIDDWGVFKFLVIRLRSRGDKQRILLRGRNFSSEGKLLEELNKEMLGICTQRGLALETPEIMGGGLMEWRRDRDRHLHIHSGFVTSIGPHLVGRPASAPELLNLAVVLVRQTLAPHYKITVEGGREL